LRSKLLPALLVALTVAGCQTARVEQPLTALHGSNDPDDQLEFWHRLAEQPVTSNDEAFHGLLMYLDGEDPASDYPGRVRELRARRLLPPDFDEPADRAVSRGTLAVAIVRSIKIAGGLALRLFGNTPALSPRYAVRELMFMELYPPSSPQQTFSGTEFLGIIGKLQPRGPEVPPEPRPGAEPPAATDNPSE
jgi:hypothetical protein